MEQTVTPGQAQWIVERLLAERRITEADVRRYVDDMGCEISALEGRIAELRQIAGTGSSGGRRAMKAMKPTSKAQNARVGRGQGVAARPRGIAGTLAVLLRAIPAAEHSAIQAIRTKQGIRAAIKAAQATVKRERARGPRVTEE